jgi:hypothetical protein
VVPPATSLFERRLGSLNQLMPALHNQIVVIKRICKATVRVQRSVPSLTPQGLAPLESRSVRAPAILDDQRRYTGSVDYCRIRQLDRCFPCQLEDVVTMVFDDQLLQGSSGDLGTYLVAAVTAFIPEGDRLGDHLSLRSQRVLLVDAEIPLPMFLHELVQGRSPSEHLWENDHARLVQLFSAAIQQLESKAIALCLGALLHDSSLGDLGHRLRPREDIKKKGYLVPDSILHRYALAARLLSELSKRRRAVQRFGREVIDSLPPILGGSASLSPLRS